MEQAEFASAKGVPLAVRVLERLSFTPTNETEPPATEALARFHAEIPGFASRIRGHRVLDFGCGTGDQLQALRALGAGEVAGVENNPRLLPALRDRFDGRARIAERVRPDMEGAFDVVLSRNAMEHFVDLDAALRDMKRALAPGGEIVASFGPLWYAPYGAHMYHFTKVPWVHLLFSERTVMRVRARYRDDGATRYEDVEGGLGKLSLGRFELAVEDAGLRFTHRRYGCVRRLDFLEHLPALRELFVNHVSCVLEPGSGG